ncbi:unnamed protein product [Trichobilharzia szidati]|nr:unnamed protein product [Trichobilharzia szidati]
MTVTWSKLICQAEKLLGGPAPFINLASILSSEAGSLASRARRLASNVNHPFFSTVRSCLRGKSVNNLFSISSAISDHFSPPITSERPTGGLIILLVGQSYASPTNSTKLCNQHRSLAEIFETVHTAVAIHKSLVDLDDVARKTDDTETWMKNMEVANKLATLSGDVLLASVSTSLAKLHHAKAVDIISEAMGNMVEAEFHELALTSTIDFNHTVENNLDANPIHLSPTEKWLSFVQLSRGALLGSCCEAALLLVEKHVSSSSSIPVELTRDWNEISSTVKSFGSTWACLTRLTEEREHIQRTWFTDLTADTYQSVKGIQAMKRNDYTPSEIIPHYTEFGLSEPTFADAILSCSASKTHHKLKDIVDEVLSEYNQIGFELAGKLREYFAQIVSMNEQINGDSLQNVKHLPGVQILGQMVDKLIDDCNCTP